MKRKTISVDEVKAMVNDMIFHSMDNKVEGRIALGIMLENILHKTGNYRGFAYLSELQMKESKEGTTVGIRYDKGPNSHFVDTDHTRVSYF